PRAALLFSFNDPATTAEKLLPMVPSSPLRHCVGRLCTFPEIAFHLQAGRKLRVGWRERLRFNAFQPVRCRESRPVFIQLLACALFIIETAFQIHLSVLRISGLCCAATARGYIPTWDTVSHSGALTNPDAKRGTGRNGNHHQSS